MNLVDQLLGVWGVCLVEAHGVPAVRAPVLPVLDDDIERQLAAAELVECVDDLGRAVEAFAAMNVAEGPETQQAMLAQIPATAGKFSSGIVQCKVPLSLVPGESDGPVFQAIAEARGA